MDLKLSGHSAVVMGGSSGLGAGIARSMAAEGVHVYLISRNTEKLQHTAAQIQAEGGKATWIAADLSSLAGVQTAITTLQEHCNVIDIIIGNGGGPPPGPATSFDAALWKQQTEAMLLPVMSMTDAFLPAMRKQKFGRIIMVSSTSVAEPIPGLVLSNALRSALANWGKTLSREVGRDGVTVNTLMPGRFDTDRVAQLNQTRAQKQGISVAELRQQKENEIPVGRYGSPEEFGHMATFLASPLAAYVTGALIPIDGGLLRSL
ncbi:SDR family oxidoreductase [Saccharibacter sp. 17.LH.SD]|uniref:SDR family oxidoreductase n=1 Tax=Saccharibacter sp. 17.LH.SD TaxID=2689393 RepID=UPI001367D0EB|nr:SDR family oxidoreductase [Saccharibacter sp. 17.LH.SD]MXV44160.1 SDR family oxidoreductase [Saccharibacter sp. 17.LH.SD]